MIENKKLSYMIFKKTYNNNRRGYNSLFLKKNV